MRLPLVIFRCCLLEKKRCKFHNHCSWKLFIVGPQTCEKSPPKNVHWMVFCLLSDHRHKVFLFLIWQLQLLTPLWMSFRFLFSLYTTAVNQLNSTQPIFWQGKSGTPSPLRDLSSHGVDFCLSEKRFCPLSVSKRKKTPNIPKIGKNHNVTCLEGLWDINLRCYVES